MNGQTITVCIACLEPADTNIDGLCERCVDVHADHLPEILALIGHAQECEE